MIGTIPLRWDNDPAHLALLDTMNNVIRDSISKLTLGTLDRLFKPDTADAIDRVLRPGDTFTTEDIAKTVETCRALARLATEPTRADNLNRFAEYLEAYTTKKAQQL